MHLLKNSKFRIFDPLAHLALKFDPSLGTIIDYSKTTNTLRIVCMTFIFRFNFLMKIEFVCLVWLLMGNYISIYYCRQESYIQLQSHFLQFYNKYFALNIHMGQDPIRKLESI